MPSSPWANSSAAGAATPASIDIAKTDLSNLPSAPGTGIAGIIQSPNYAAGTTSTPPVGVKISGTSFSITLLGGSTITGNMEMGNTASFGGYQVATVNTRTMTAYNRILNGYFYNDLNSWTLGSTTSSPPAYNAATKTAGTGSCAVSFTAAGTLISNDGWITQSFSCPPSAGSVFLNMQTGISTNSSHGDTQTIKAYLLNQSTGVETLVATYSYTLSSQSLAWTARSVDITSLVSGGGSYSLKILFGLNLSVNSSSTITLYVDEISIST